MVIEIKYADKHNRPRVMAILSHPNAAMGSDMEVLYERWKEHCTKIGIDSPAQRQAGSFINWLVQECGFKKEPAYIFTVRG